MPKNEGKPHDGITFILGNHRSQQNLSKIRKHASKSSKLNSQKGVARDAPTPNAVERADSPNSQSHGGRGSAQSENDQSSSNLSPSPTPTTDLAHDNSLVASSARHGVQERWSSSRPNILHQGEGELVQPLYHVYESSSSENLGSLESRDHESPSSAELLDLGKSLNPSYGIQRRETTALSLRPSKRAMSFTTAGTAIGTWFEEYPAMQASATFKQDFDPHGRARLPFMGIQPSEPSEPSGSSVRSGTLALANAREMPPRLAMHEHKGTVAFPVPKQASLEHRLQVQKRKSQVLRTRWRLGTAPKPIALPTVYDAFENLLLGTNAYYISRFDSTWQPMLQQNSEALDGDGRLDSFYESVITVAALIEGGQPFFADLIIRRNLSIMEDLLRSEHPRLYSVLAVMSLDTSSSVLGQFNQKFVQAILPVARRVLGDNHPCTILLRCDLSPESKSRLHEAIQRRIQELLSAKFGGTGHQTYEGAFIVARIMGQLGRIEEALSILNWLKPRWEGIHGMNSMLAVYILLEEASVLLSIGQSGVRTEMILSDALRRMKIMEGNTRSIPEMERQQQLIGLMHQRVAALRAYGKLHIMRRNYVTALSMYRQAMDLGIEVLGENAFPTQLAKGDYLRARASGIEHWSVDYTPDDAEQVESVDTVLGPIRRSSVAFGREPRLVPVDKTVVYGFVPFEDSKWREGVGTA